MSRRVPVVLQMTTSDCGPACLASLLRHHGRRVSLAQSREHLAAGRDGVTAKTLLAGGRSYGLEGRAFAVHAPSAVVDLPLPAIGHWEDAHYVVIEGATERYVELMDPAIGRRRVTWTEFEQSLGGVVLALTPGPRFAPLGSDDTADATAWRDRMSRLRDRIPRAGRTLLTALGASLVLQLLTIALPLATALVIDRVVVAQDRDLLPAIAGAGFLLTAVYFGVAHLRSELLIRLQADVDGALMRWVFGHLLSLPLRFFQQRSSGDLLQRLANTVVIRELVTTQALAAVLDSGFMLVYLVLLVVASPLLGGVVAGLGLAQLVLLLAVRTHTHDLQQRHLLAQSRSQSLLFEALRGVATVKATGSEDRLFDAWSRRLADEIAVDARRGRLESVVENVTGALRVLAPLAVVWVGAHQVLDGRVSLGTMIAMQALALAFLVPLASVVANLHRLQSARAHLERLQDVLDEVPEQSGPAPRPVPRLSGRVEVRSVTFQYGKHSPPVLRDIDLTIEPGQKVAIVGRSGSGKTTLGMLLLGLHAPTTGDVLYDGIPLGDLDRRELRAQFGVVLQEPFVFGDSIRRNIAGNQPDMPLDGVVRAARLAAFDGDVARMPMGYETRLGDGGSGLSGGQRQRLAIARAVARDPALLLLDESTSHLDVLNERLVDQNLTAMSCTRVVIAHRVSTVRNADLVLVLEDGRIVERGTHEELVRGPGLYAALVGGQDPGHQRERVVSPREVPA